MVNRLGTTFSKDPKTVGLSIGIVDHGKSYFYNFGTTTVGQHQPPTQHTIYEVGSITKTFVSFILAQAVLEHKVSLQDDIRTYLKGSYPNLAYKGHPIRLVHLANTTSLLPDWLPELPAQMKTMTADSALSYKIKVYQRLTKQDLLAALHTVKLDTIPGFHPKHSNAAGQLLGYILEDVYQQPFEELLKKYITQPIGMKSTSFLPAIHSAQVATGYTAEGKSAVYESVMPYFKLAGGIGSTTADLVKYIQLFLSSSNQVAGLSVKKTIDVRVSTGKVVAMRAADTASPEIYSLGLSWFSYQPEANRLQVWADGGTNGFNSYLVLYPKQQSGVVLLANKSSETIFRSLPGMAYEISKVLGQN
ncbi:beta-lactamase family protein [Spirosoma sp. BT702]|uniref:Beta-lactamase family protein n=1 Tax=Spirosoma profusum TaxID=2771354 RepID=A0A927AWU3_9BACT|nr:serine hydrolase domain-containing protein [Spirosoma profusum]MBD2705844.1 beta-lactamase family protein [Spirosoma profusum]